MFNIIPFLIIVISLIVVIFIILKRFPQLSRIDTNTIQSEKESQTKHKLLTQRLQRKTEKFMGIASQLFSKYKGLVQDKVTEVHEALEEKKEEIERKEFKDLLVTQEDEEVKEEIIEEQLEQAQELSDDNNFEKAEQKYIDIITADPKNVEAYMGLGELYKENSKYQEAQETFSYVAKLNPESAEPEFAIAELLELQAKHAEAVSHSQRAVELEQNPRYITQLIEIAIIAGNKQVASSAIALLEEVNPENGAIDEYKEQISTL